MALAEIPVVAVLKSMWLLPRTRESEGANVLYEAMSLQEHVSTQSLNYHCMLNTNV